MLTACAHTQVAQPDQHALRVMTYNIQSGHGNIAGTAAAIRAEAPDIVALQEVDVHWAERSNFIDEAHVLADRLHMHVCFAPIYQLPGMEGAPPREFGVAMLSRYRIVACRNETLTRLSTQAEHPAPTPMPGLLAARVKVGATVLRVFNTHLDYRADPAVRRMQVRDMVQDIGTSTEPTLVFGDMNDTPDAAELAPLFARWHDAWPASAGAGLTYPADNPEKRIDYVLVSSQFRVREAHVPATQASDHRPVVVDLTY